MCSICGMIDFKDDRRINEGILTQMGSKMAHRGPDQQGIYMSRNVAFQHNRLSVMDIENGLQPMTAVFGGKKYTIIYNGEIYNSAELRKTLKEYNICFKTNCDTETVLYTYIVFREKAPELLNGIFAFAVLLEDENRVFLCRDRFGVKPFFYTQVGTTLLIASEIKALLAHPDVKSEIDREGLWQLLYLSPVTINGSGVFKNICEIKPAHSGYFDKDGLKLMPYWKLKAQDWKGNSTEAAEVTKEIFTDAVNRQLISDVPLAVLLSGGLDSSVITAVAAENYKRSNMQLSTYSFEYEGNKESFKQSLFQPQGDDEYAVYLSDKLGTQHTVLTAPTSKVADYLFDAVNARDIPGQADIDSSLLYFCKRIKEKHTVVLSGECSDEIFGGYPWFYREEMLYRDFFPWIHSPKARIQLFKEDIVKADEGYDFISNIYKKSILECPLTGNESKEMKTARIATWLSVNYFMTSLLERKDRMSMYSGLEVRVPFSDHRILEFVFNVPWSIKFENNTEKALLRNAMKNRLPEKILYRKKSPYPKTHNPEYERLVTERLRERLKKRGLLFELLKPNAVNELFEGEGGTWFGQLMAKPQLIAWLVQFDYWADKYNVNIVN
ncbi:MAG: asparagine synthase (glutamine-hydrolyzing) [Clostridia bacterium]|nr:asparagine synthase (glutamine-hydrolyzing) [Clostridia bacterium]